MRYLISLTLSVYLAFQPAFATLNEVDKTNIFSKNMLKNGGFENGKASWTASAGTFAVTTSSPMVGLQHATWDAAASGNTLTSGDITIPAGYFARNGAASCVFTTASGTATHEIQVYDGASILSETTITSSTTPTRTSTNFIFPSSASVSVRIFANADEPSISLDDCYLGPAEGYNVSNVSQAKFAGESYFLGTSACAWSRTSATIGAFTADTDCPGPTVVRSTVGSWQTTDVNLPEQTINNLPPGIYIATFYVNQQSGVVSNIALAINDGTTTCKATAVSTATTPTGSVVSCTFEYTSAGNRSFELYGASASSTITINGDVTSPQQHTRFMLEYFPTTQETAYTADKLANSWSGYHDNTCSWARTNTAYGDPTADATCVLTERTSSSFSTVSTSGSVLPAITFTPSRAGRYWVCALIKMQAGSANVVQGAKLWDGTTTITETESVAATTSNGGMLMQPLCGIYVASNTSAKTLSIQTRASSGSATIAAIGSASAIEWSIFQIDQSFPAPNLVNSVVSDSSGVERIVRFTFGHATEGTVCSSSPCTIYRQSGGVSSVTRSSTGIYVANFSPAFSAAPTCTGSASNATGPAIIFPGAHTTTTAAINIARGSPEGYSDGANVNVICIGPK